jgi:hypothetical protein
MRNLLGIGLILSKGVAVYNPAQEKRMSQGEILGIFTAIEGGAPLVSCNAVRALPGRGLEGDRYFLGTGTFATKKGKLPHSQEASFIESKALAAIRRDKGRELGPAQSRRNIVTRGIALNHLVGKEFMVGDVRFKGLKLCEPCGHLEKLTQQGVREALIHRGGLRAQILTEGVIRVGDQIVPADVMESAACV